MGCCESSNRHNEAFFSNLISAERNGKDGGAGIVQPKYKRPVVNTGFSDRSKVLKVPEQYPTVAAAIKAANESDRVLISEGIYNEALVIEKSLELVGLGDKEGVVIKAQGATALTVENIGTDADKKLSVKVSNLSLQVVGGRGNFDHVIDNEGGSLHLQDCILLGGYWGLLNSNAALAVLINNKIQGCCGYGVFTADRSTLWMEGNTVSGHLLSGINVQGDGSKATLLDNNVCECKANGFMACAQAQVFMERNSICNNGDAGVSVCDSGTQAVVKSNTISKNGLVGIYVFDDASAVVEDNDLRENAHLALSVHKDCANNVVCHGNIA